MKFKNIETGTIIEVPKDRKDRIEKFRQYPDKFVEIGEMLSNKLKKEDEIDNKTINDKKKKR